MVYVLQTSAYSMPVYVSSGYQWTDCIGKALKWANPCPKTLNEYSRILREDLHFKPVNNSK